ncbi:peptidylprolyl isomerase D (cyclophilin D) [Chlorella sorokiniana]|uniref:Peptidylprolyl isomerase D (Cyclophilin D) n=1 Tax=Chlorella sorokiniana TaxID=3076 RepID=A0A2P6TT50_CHLSO|nr:peptidylprolyl isomerase D (cyclophilin D) [Chlorella sorokiniana]|eukprot:PRW57245.1 peptidylprolyl isomerase D (cyclophilin D) [Chlorella sorokiniana]
MKIAALLVLTSLAAAQGRGLLQAPGSSPLMNHFGACSEQPNTEFTNPDLAIIYNVDTALSCCQFCQGFSTISSQPCGGYSWKANECHLKPTGELTKSSNSAFTSGEVSTPRNFSAGAVVATPPVTGESNVQDCCNHCMASQKCNMFAWCDPALAKEGKCDPAGLNDKSLPGECTLWLSVEATTTVQYCTNKEGALVTWQSGIIEGRDPPKN